MSSEKLFNYWIEGSEKNFDDMVAIFNAKRYDWALFLGHLTLEKLLKAIYAKTHVDKPIAPKIHDLVKLAQYSDIPLDKEQTRKLASINNFCIEARYTNEKSNFYKVCTKEFAEQKINEIKELRKWLKEKLVKN